METSSIKSTNSSIKSTNCENANLFEENEPKLKQILPLKGCLAPEKHLPIEVFPQGQHTELMPLCFLGHWPQPKMTAGTGSVIHVVLVLQA